MKLAFEGLMVTGLMLIGLYASISDFRSGIIKNSILSIFAGAAILIDGIYYGFIVRDLTLEFLLNYLIVAVLAMVLFFTSSWAGGDCKLSLVLGLLFPARLYVATNGTNLTLFFSLLIAFLLGYGYLITDAIFGLISNRDKLSLTSIKDGMLLFFKYYLAATAYLVTFDLLYQLLVSRYLVLNPIILSLTGFAVALSITSIKKLLKPYIFLPLLCIDTMLCVIFRIFPLSGDIMHYVIVFLLAFFRILINSKNYIALEAEAIKPGMILSSASSVILAQRIPSADIQLSSEKLNSRLTAEQAAKIVEWGKKKKETVWIVRRIPFAVFIFLGFVLYLIWGGLTL